MTVMQMTELPYEMPVSFWNLLLGHARRYPLMEVEDLYKLLHQAALGSEHAVADLASVHKALDAEFANIEPGADEPLIEPISPDGQIARVHLRPYKNQKANPEYLLRAFVRTANGFPGSLDRLRSYWAHAEALAAFEGLPVRSEEIHIFFSEMAVAGFPAVHHSEAFQNAYHPAYRVVWVQVLEKAKR